MCSGKTSLGKYLAKKMKLKFIDLDEYIEEKENLSIAQIFEERGEGVFRDMEHNYLKDLSNLDDVVIATGGGSPCFRNNMRLINEVGISVYLKTSVAVLIDRLLIMGDSRPLVKGKSREELNKFIIPHLRDRESFYLSSNIILDGDNWDEERIANELIKELNTKN